MQRDPWQSMSDGFGGEIHILQVALYWRKLTEAPADFSSDVARDNFYRI